MRYCYSNSSDVKLTCKAGRKHFAKIQKASTSEICSKENLPDTEQIFKKSNGTCIGLHIKKKSNGTCIGLHIKKKVKWNMYWSAYQNIQFSYCCILWTSTYESFTFHSFTQDLKNVLNSLQHPTPNITLMRDFNFRFINWCIDTKGRAAIPSVPNGDQDKYKQAQELIEFCNELFLTEGTRNTSVLDLIFINARELIHDIELENTTQSDHKLITIQSSLALNIRQESGNH